MSATLTRAELYGLVWSEPLRTLSKKFGISDVALAKHCRRGNIPLPGLGYWAKKEAGKPVIQPALPPRALGQHEHLVFGPDERFSQQQEEERLLSTPIEPPPEFADGFAEVFARAKVQAGKIRAPSLSRPHPIIARLFKDDEKRRQKQAASSYPSSLDNPIFDNPFEKRRLRVMNAIFLSLAQAGCVCSARGKEANELTAMVGDSPVQFSIVPIKKPAYSYPPKPLPLDTPMKLEVEWYQAPQDLQLLWEDDKDSKVDDKLEGIVPTLIAYGEMKYRHALRWRYDWQVERRRELEERLRKERAEAKRTERERIAKEAAARRSALLEEASNWRKAAVLRAYVDARLTRLKSSESPSPDIDAWATWALAEADALDPLIAKNSG